MTQHALNISTDLLTFDGAGPILAVDDDIGFLFLLKHLHNSSLVNNVLHTFEDASKCLEFLKNYPTDGNDPCAVLMDINMPGINGIEAVRLIRQIPRFQQVPVICMLTSSRELRDAKLAQKVGADQFMSKSDIVLQRLLFPRSKAA